MKRLFRIQRLKQTSSTNTLAREAALKGAKEGLVIVADYQTNGRGKPGRKWISPAGKNLLFSVLVRPSVPASKIPLITQITCRSVAKSLKNSCGVISKFKRPNDIMVHGKKICGVLVEASSGSSGKVDHVVIGIGLNVNASEDEVPAEGTSILCITDKKQNRSKLLASILRHLSKDLEQFDAYSA